MTTSRNTLASYLQVFDSTLASTLTPSEALGAMNFAILFHEESFISDISLGDNQHLINSWLEDTTLFQSLREFIAAKVVIPHFRDVASIEDDARFKNPSMSEVQAVWQQRDARQGRNHFTHQIDRSRVAEYSAEIDRLLSNTEVVRYSPDGVKSRFRENIRASVSQGTIADQLATLEPDARELYRQAVEAPFFTRADLWEFTKDHAILNHVHAALNEQAFAHGIAGVSSPGVARAASVEATLQSEVAFAQSRDLEEPRGQELRSPPRARLSLHVAQDLKPFDELLDADNCVALSSPALRLLALLNPDQVLDLQAIAKKTIFEAARAHANLPAGEFMRAYVPVFQGFLEDIGEQIAHWYPMQFAACRTQRVGLLYGATAAQIARECGHTWVSLRSHAADALRETAIGASLGAFAGMEFHRPLTEVSLLAAAGGLGASVPYLNRALNATRKLTTFDLVVVWDDSRLTELMCSTPTRWMREAHAANKWLL